MRFPSIAGALCASVLTLSFLLVVSRDHAADAGPAEDGGSRRPNLLVIQTDEHHYGTLGCYGGTIVETPHIDWLARTGALATSFYATTPVCSPSRAAFVSGRYPQHTPVVTNNIPLADDIVTFAEILRRQGYATGYAGKWHLDGAGKPQWAPERRFGFEDNRFLFNRGHWKKLEDTPGGPRVAARNAKGKPSYAVDGADKTSFTTDWLADKAVRFIEAHAGEPFCYVVSFPDPHGPNTVRAPYDAMYADVCVPIPASLGKSAEETPSWAPKARGVTARSLQRIQPRYYGMVKGIDDNVGKIVGALRARGLLDRTIVVFTADHGDLCGEHGRLNKGVPYEGSARIPFVIRYPARVPAGRVVDEALSCVDFLPTILALMDVPTAGKEQGRDASALFAGAAPEGWRDLTFLRSTPGNVWLCAVTGRHKLVVSAADRPWLFDLEADPDELRNRIDDPSLRDVVRRMAKGLLEYGTRYRDPYLDDPGIRSGLDAALGLGEGAPGRSGKRAE